MKEIKTSNFKKKQADLIEHPPIFEEKEDMSGDTEDDGIVKMRRTRGVRKKRKVRKE